MATSHPAPHPAAETTSERTFFGHPWGLASLFGVEMWERFSFYGLQAILAYYLYYEVTKGGLGMDQATATSIVGAYGGLVYLMSVVGAWVADRLLSAERTLFFSAIIVMVGHLCLSLIPGYLGLALGLVFIAVGSGGVKTTASAVLGELYDRTDPRRDGGFSIFYMGVNIGGLIGPLITNALWGWKGFHVGFLAAAVMMAIGLVQYTVMRRSTLKGAGEGVPNPLPKSQYLPWAIGAVVVVGAVVAAFATGLAPVSQLSTFAALSALVLAVVLFLQMYRSDKVDAEERSRLLGFIPMFVGGVVFFALFQQQFTVLAVYADQRLDRNLFGVEIKPGMVQSINPLFIVIFSAVFAAIWTKLGNRQPSYPVKFAMSLPIIGLGMLCLLPFAGGGANSTPFLVIVLVYFLFTMAELLLSPVGNSMATRLAPKAFGAEMFALWMLAVSVGTALSGSLASFYHPGDVKAEKAFLIAMFVMCAVASLLIFVMRRWILKKFVDVR